MKFRKKVLRRTPWIAAGLYLATQLLLLISIQFPRGHNFDEFHHVPRAQALLRGEVPQKWEHPPFGQYIVGIGIAIDQDRPFGWRWIGTTFGALTLAGIFLLAFELLGSHRSALFAAGVTFFNQIFYVQSRVAMLDGIMFTFMVWALYFLARSYRATATPRENLTDLTVTGVLFGLALATKWSAALGWGGALSLVVLVRLLQKWGVTFKKQGSRSDQEEWYSPKLWRGVPARRFAILLIALPLAIYFVTFLPLLFYPGGHFGLLDLFRVQGEMWARQSEASGIAHPYASHWASWPFLLRPIWYAFDLEGPSQQWVRSVFMVGNPLVMWSGIIALLICVSRWVRNRSRAAFFILFFYFFLFAGWAFIPRKAAFYYYYYPAGMMLSLALAYVFHEIPALRRIRWHYLLVAIVVFTYFFPVLAALRVPALETRRWMWFSNWI